MARTFYVTTPIYYINDVPHLGTAYTNIDADVIRRYQRLRGNEARVLTGIDEHGLKVQRVAEEQGMAPQAFADGMAPRFQETWPALACPPDDFVRTSEPRHKLGAQELWKTIDARGDIYLGHYEGLYCVGCEAYYTEKDLDQPGNVCKVHHRPVELVKEESYFFRLSRYGDKLLEHYAQNPSFIRPQSRLNEVTSFVREGLSDLSISRTTFDWGVPVPDDPRHVMYVWFDALSNYYTALQRPLDNTRFWPADVHVIGKDILRFHAVYWPAFLMSAGMQLPRQIFAHGFLTYNGRKMSKSLRNTLKPQELTQAISEQVGMDVLRYTLMRAISFGQDGDFSIHDLLQRYSSELGNTLGNLQNRILPFARPLHTRGADTELEQALRQHYAPAEAAVRDAYEDKNPTAALGAIWALLARGNEYVDKAAPWVAKKQGDSSRLATIVTSVLELLESVSVMVAPVMPNVAIQMRAQLGLPALDWQASADVWPLTWPERRQSEPPGGAPIFPRLEKEHEARIIAQFTPPPAQGESPAVAASPEAAAPKTTIGYDDFAKIDLRVGVVLSAERVKKKDRLLDLRVDTGGPEPRRIVAGVAAAYAPEALVGKRIVVLCNLAPRDFGKGLVSEGMLLAAEDESGLRVVTLDGDKRAGSPVK
jgi:methionyl-tRNA synthetase